MPLATTVRPHWQIFTGVSVRRFVHQQVRHVNKIKNKDKQKGR
jgi:hypothetical protein